MKQFSRPGLAVVAAAATLSIGLTGCTESRTVESAPAGADGGPVKIGLVTKTETNPYFVKLREEATAAAEANGNELIALSGKFDGDNDGQIAAVENLVQQGVSGILITPSNATGILDAIEKAEDAGIVVIALDTETDPADVVSATYATDNTEAGRLLGAYIKARLGDTQPQILTMDLDPSASVGVQRRTGFLEGMGVPEDSPDILGSAITQGDQTKAQQGAENLLQRVGEQVNVVYNINEPAARGSYQALKDRNLTDRVLVGAIDGSCEGVQDVADGEFAATVMQFPKEMAVQGVAAVENYAATGEKPSGFIDTGAMLITDDPVDGMESQDTAWGAENCWG